ncbi:CotO family spore coat protein [Paenibacillus sp. 102]|uniref:CotO family spore coat protein n=1 Tax=Paenibacillus sp. 102 TaxID=3120823 RepID=UPI0031B9E82C
MKRKPSKKKDKRSIIYISQPTFDEAKLNMQKTFVIKPEKQVEYEREEEIDTKEEEIINIKKEADVKAEAEVIEKVKKEAINIKEEADVKAEAKVIEKVKKEVINIKEEADVKAEAEVIEKVKKEAINIKEEADVKVEAEVIEKVKKEAINIKEEADVKVEAEVIEKVKKEVINIKEEVDVKAKAEGIKEIKEGLKKELQDEGKQPETEVIAEKENKEFAGPALNEGKAKEVGSPKGVRKRKSFKDMNNEEKIYYLIHQPKYIPKVRCQINTVEKKLTGYVLSYKEGYVAIKMIEKTKEIKVKFEDIVHIKMMGL